MKRQVDWDWLEAMMATSWPDVHSDRTKRELLEAVLDLHRRLSALERERAQSDDADKD